MSWSELRHQQKTNDLQIARGTDMPRHHDEGFDDAARWIGKIDVVRAAVWFMLLLMLSALWSSPLTISMLHG